MEGVDPQVAPTAYPQGNDFHQIWYLMFDHKFYLAPVPIETTHRILDVGTGGGEWPLAISEKFQHAEIIGTDITPVVQTEKAPNVSYMIDDLSKEWTVEGEFDYIHARALVSVVKDWRHFFEQAYEKLKPGGWVELDEFTFPLLCESGFAPDDLVIDWSHKFYSACFCRGIDLSNIVGLEDEIASAGFINVSKRNKKFPFNPWGEEPQMLEVGELCAKSLSDDLSPLSVALFTQAFGWSEENIVTYLQEVRKEIFSKDVHRQVREFIYYAQKPEDSEPESEE
ncbi:MAG: hypothetical protein M1834_001111 [Cirrosporium novae-zelandiae]|nr:MAG: hypothetical protein M1834_001111 [Cirrosporium novae-zelandiae]